MNYEINKKSNVKNMINDFVSSRNASSALVIDAETLLTSTALYEGGMKKENTCIDSTFFVHLKIIAYPGLILLHLSLSFGLLENLHN